MRIIKVALLLQVGYFLLLTADEFRTERHTGRRSVLGSLLKAAVIQVEHLPLQLLVHLLGADAQIKFLQMRKEINFWLPIC